MALVGVCMKQTYFLPIGEQHFWAGTMVLLYNAPLPHILPQQKMSASCDLDIALWQIRNFIIFD